MREKTSAAVTGSAEKYGNLNHRLNSAIGKKLNLLGFRQQHSTGVWAITEGEVFGFVEITDFQSRCYWEEFDSDHIC